MYYYFYKKQYTQNHAKKGILKNIVSFPVPKSVYQYINKQRANW